MATAEEEAAAAAEASRLAAEAAAAAAQRSSQSESDDEEDDSESSDGLSEIERIAKGLMEAQGGTYRPNSPEAKVVRKLVHDTFKLRGKNTQLRQRIVGDGDVIVKRGTEADHLAGFRALGKSPAEIKARLQLADTLETKVKAHERATFFSDVADGLGYVGRGKKAFIRVAQKEGIDLQMKEVEIEDAEGKKSKVLKPFAKLATEPDAKLKPIDQYVEEEWGDYLPAFEAEGSEDSEADDDSAERRTHAAKRKNVVPMVDQSGSSRKAGEKNRVQSTADTFVDSTYGHLKAKK